MKPFLFSSTNIKFLEGMTITKKNLSTSIQGIGEARNTHETGEILSLNQQLETYKRLFEIEKNCKNQAYFFILSCGHFEEYRGYCKTHPTNVDYHSACVDSIRLQLLKD
jgi:hypothetical protein